MCLDMGSNISCDFVYLDRNQSLTLEIIKSYILELLKLNDKKRIHDELLSWDPPIFEITGKCLTEINCPTGTIRKQILQKMRKLWVKSRFTIGKQELLDQLPNILIELKKQKIY